MSFTIDRPIRFAGTQAEADANFNTHYFDSEYGRCYDCDSRPTHAAAEYPCGTEPPREIVTVC